MDGKVMFGYCNMMRFYVDFQRGKNLTLRIGCADWDQRTKGSQWTTSKRVNTMARFIQDLRTCNTNIKVIVLVRGDTLG